MPNAEIPAGVAQDTVLQAMPLDRPDQCALVMPGNALSHFKALACLSDGMHVGLQHLSIAFEIPAGHTAVGNRHRLIKGTGNRQMLVQRRLVRGEFRGVVFDGEDWPRVEHGEQPIQVTQDDNVGVDPEGATVRRGSNQERADPQRPHSLHDLGQGSGLLEGSFDLPDVIGIRDRLDVEQRAVRRGTLSLVFGQANIEAGDPHGPTLLGGEVEGLEAREIVGVGEGDDALMGWWCGWGGAVLHGECRVMPGCPNT